MVSPKPIRPPTVTMSYATIDALLARENAFHDFCNEVAESYVEEYGDTRDDDEHIIEWLGQACYDMMTADAEDLINSYGLTRAIQLYHEDVMERLDNPDIYAHALLHDIAGDRVIGRVKGLLMNRKSSS